ncbi:pre-peptidase C-terminal domain-containing protein [Brevibacillus ruminantium]|uniref:Pre-peptidase C-terminal domain-containing protein n=1 Tax=Brevibacillus ruminantium TaxID=2950604 RepID=A0ABY4WEZ8_9BACL|nr:pre-peptidase C-terminal domain-containing protein [Brevibacillus ruminantium]USG65469.1 pre-peptidase C-terminal domain-containing protein [Brevibacillus ruminantium]
MKKFARITRILVLMALLFTSITPTGFASEELRRGKQLLEREAEEGFVPSVLLEEWLNDEGEPGQLTDDEVEESKETNLDDQDDSPNSEGQTDEWEEAEDLTEQEAELVDEAEHLGELDQAEIEKNARAFYRRFAGAKKLSEADLRKMPTIYEMEPNDTFNYADWLTVGRPAYGKIRTGSDVDMWKVKPKDNGTLSFSLVKPSRADYHLYVYDEEKRELGSSKEPVGKDQKIEEIYVEKEKFYYIQIVGNNGSFDPFEYYRIRADFFSNNEMALDPYEPNNSIKEAYELTPGKITANLHRIDDVDFYAVTLDKASTIVVNLTDIPEGMDLDLILYDSQQKRLASSEKAKNMDEEIVYNGDPGTYYIKVFASRTSGFKNHAYQLEVKVDTIPIILIPGIGGSRLLAKDKVGVYEAWLGLVETGVGINNPLHRHLLSLEPKSKNSVEVKQKNEEFGLTVFPEKEDEGFRAIEYLSYTFNQNFVKKKVEQYASMVQRLEEMGYTKNLDLFAMPYDWRYSNKDNAKFLKQKIDEALKSSGARQVQLVAHSMGGLLTKETLLSNISYQSKVKRVIYMGTPFLGSPRAYQALKFGYDFGVPLLHEETGKIIAEYAPAVYELLPSPMYFQKGTVLKRDPVYAFTYEDMLKDNRVKLDYLPLLRQAEILHNKWDKLTLRVPQYSIIGFGQPTLLGYEYHSGHGELLPFFDHSGDGTVPLLSANYSLKDMVKKYYIPEGHASLPKNPQVIEQVIQLLQGIESAQTGLRRNLQQDSQYLYYILSREDGSFPEISFQKSGKTMTISRDKKEDWENLRVEYHGNIVVIHVLDQEPLLFLQPSQLRGVNSSPSISIEKYSSTDRGGATYDISMDGGLDQQDDELEFEQDDQYHRRSRGD